MVAAIILFMVLIVLIDIPILALVFCVPKAGIEGE